MIEFGFNDERLYLLDAVAGDAPTPTGDCA